MKYNNILLIFALFLTAHATEIKYEFASLAEVQDISQTSYGKSLLETVSLSLKSGGDISSIRKLLSQLFFKLTQDQRKSDKRWKKTNKRLSRTIRRLGKKIKKLGIEISILSRRRAKLRKKVKKVNKNLRQYRKQIGANRSEIKSLNLKRKNDKGDFKRSRRNHLAIINAIGQVVRELKKLIGSISGRGKPAHVKAISQEKRDKAWLKRHKKAFMQITKDEQETLEFVQMATQADQRALARLIRLLNKLKRNAKKSYNADTRAERGSKNTYRKLLKTLNSDIRKLGRMILQSNRNKKKYNTKIRRLTRRIGSKKSFRKASIKERKARIAERRIKKGQYLKDKKQRGDEEKVIRKLQKIVKTRLANMSAFLRKHTGA